MKVRRIKLGSAVEFYRNDEQAVLCNEGDWGCYMNGAPLPPLSLSPEIDKSQYEILIRSKNFHLTNLRVSVILAIKFKQVHAVNERKSEVRSLREPVDGENRCDVSVIYHS